VISMVNRLPRQQRAPAIVTIGLGLRRAPIPEEPAFIGQQHQQ
jgi:hypothetical protein